MKNEKCICNHANPEDCFPKIRCACKVHGKFHHPVEEKEKHAAISLGEGKYVLAWDNRCEECKAGIKHPAKEIMESQIPSFTVLDEKTGEGWVKSFDKNRREKWHYLDVNDEYTKQIKAFFYTELALAHARWNEELVRECEILKAKPLPGYSTVTKRNQGWNEALQEIIANHQNPHA